VDYKKIGLHPDNALKIALKIYDTQSSDEDRVKLLLNNRAINNLNSIDLPKNFASGKTIDLNVSELLGIGCVADYYLWNSMEANTGNTYQAVVGVEDAAKNQIENILSDGAVYHDQTNKNILAQQVMVQGYFPDKRITNEDVIEAIKKKMALRDRYHENCILIVNAFGNDIAIDLKTINDEIKDLTDQFTDVYLVVYNLPSLTLANVSYISVPEAKGLTIKLERHEFEDKWEFNKNGLVS